MIECEAKMALDPSDLMIFKLRKQREEKQEAQSKEAKPASAPVVQKETAPSPAAPQKEEPVAVYKEELPMAYRQKTQAHTPKPQRETAMSKPAPAPAPVTQQKQPGVKAPAPVQKPVWKAWQPSAPKPKAEPVQKAPPAKTPPPAPAKQPKPEKKEPMKEPKPKHMSFERQQMESAKGKSCANHPWRPAYALCATCSTPYCYADLMKHEGKFYCLADIDKVSTIQAKKAIETGISAFNYIASVLFIASAAVLAVATYPQVFYIAGAIAKSGALKFFGNLSATYYIPLLNTALIFVSVIAAAAILAKSGKAFSFSLVVAMLFLMFASYEYLTSNVTYTMILTAIMLVNIPVLVYSRMSSISHFTDERISIPDVAWPKPEVF